MAHQKEWFVSCSVEGNEAVAQYLADQCRATGAHMFAQLCLDGKQRNLWRIEGGDVRILNQARAKNPSWQLKFYTKSSPGAKPAHFSVKPKKKKAA